MKTVLNVGAGHKSIALPTRYAEWDCMTLDIDPKSEADLVCDARRMNLLTRVKENFDAVFCSHNLEHYYLHDVGSVLDGFRYVLNETGFAEIHVPNMRWVFDQLQHRDISEVMYESPAGPITARDMIYGHAGMIASSGEDFMCHKNGFTPTSLGQLLLNHFDHVFIGEQAFDLVAFSFINKPTKEQMTFCKLRYDESSAAADNADSVLLPAQPEAVVAGPIHQEDARRQP